MARYVHIIAVSVFDVYTIMFIIVQLCTTRMVQPLNGRVVFVDYAKPKTDRGWMPIARGPPEPPIEQ